MGGGGEWGREVYMRWLMVVVIPLTTHTDTAQVSKLKRHLDKVAVMKFWETLDKLVCVHQQ